MITSAANTLVLDTVIAATLNEIDTIGLNSSSGEYFTKIVTDIVVINSTKKTYSFFISESEGNGTIESISLKGNGITFATQPLSLIKSAFESLTINWTIELI